NSNYGRAFAHYLVFFELVGHKKDKYEKQFAEILCVWGKFLEERNQVEDLCKCYLQALNYFPLNTQILNNFGAHLLRIGEYEEAKKYLQLAHTLAPDFLLAEKNLITLRGQLIER
ncbi:Tetratricopeptide repeat-containing protein, partial [Oryctes borbonicus]